MVAVVEGEVRVKKTMVMRVMRVMSGTEVVVEVVAAFVPHLLYSAAPAVRAHPFHSSENVH